MCASQIKPVVSLNYRAQLSYGIAHTVYGFNLFLWLLNPIVPFWSFQFKPSVQEISRVLTVLSLGSLWSLDSDVIT